MAPPPPAVDPRPRCARGFARVTTRPRGVALVTVLLLVAGLIAIATAVVTLSVSQRRAAQRAFEAGARREALDGALRVALVEMAHGKVDGPFWHPRQPRIVEVGGKRVEVTLERESGRVDLNTAEEKYLVAVLVAAGRDEERARAGAARIRDWIDADDAVTAKQGAERAQYQAAGVTTEPRNGPFESVDEVRQVLGLEDLSDEAVDAFTVYAQLPEPSASEAPPLVRKALAWMAGVAGEGGVNAVFPETLPDAMQAVSYAGAVVRLRACVEAEREAPCRVTVQRVTGSARQPFLVLAWK